MKKRIELIQLLLKQKNMYDGNVDGIMGPNTLNQNHYLHILAQGHTQVSQYMAYPTTFRNHYFLT